MLLCSVKLKKNSLSAVCLLCALALVLASFFALRWGSPKTADIGGVPYPLSAESEDDVRAFLSAAGAKPDETVISREIVIPDNFDGAYASYAAMQTAQGLELEKHRGDSAKEYIFSLKDRADFAEVLVADDVIVAAHLSKMNGGGDLTPLLPTENAP